MAARGGPTGRWLPITAGEIELRRIAAIPVTRYRYRAPGRLSENPGPVDQAPRLVIEWTADL